MRRRIPLVPLLAIGATAIGLTALGENAGPLPTPFPMARYERMSAKSPFAVASAASAPTAAPTPGFAAQLYVDGIAHLGTKDYVILKSKETDKPNAIYLTVGEPAPDGMLAERVKWSTQLGKSAVDVSMHGERATLVFDQDQIVKNSAPANQPGQPPGIRLPMMPGQGRPMNFQNGGFRGYGPQAQGVPGMPGSIPRRRLRGIIPSQ